ncbi:MAG TPA: hypothetical protein VIN58_07345 [Roseateles sp.]
MKRTLLSFALLASLSVTAVAQSPLPSWKDANGRPLQETEAMKSSAGFAGSVLVTLDEDWQAKWNTPPQTRPEFRRADVVPYGKKVFVLVFFSNAKLDAQGNANVRCDLQLIEPGGKVALEQKDVTCFAGRIAGSPYNLYLSAPVIGFSGDPGDPLGTWEVRVALRDVVRGVVLPLKTGFGLTEK